MLGETNGSLKNSKRFRKPEFSLCSYTLTLLHILDG